MSKHRTRGTRWNRLLSGVLCLAMVLGLLPATGLVQPAKAASWADPYGQQLVEWGVMNPSSDLRLDSTITRAEFVTMCNRAFGYNKLGGMPFMDVPSSAWYAQDIDIAYNAGYFKGTTTDPAYPTASPNSNLTREQAAVMVARNLMLEETVGESLGFTDSRTLSEWSRGLIGAAVAEGMLTGYSDGSYRPFNNITRGEVAAMLVRVIGTPVNHEGSYELGDVYGNVTISSSNVSLRNTTIVGNLYITGGVDLGNVLLENVTVLGRIVVSGGGESDASQSSVVMRNVEADELVVDSMIDQFVTISAYGVTDIPLTNVRSNAYLEDSSWPGYGLHLIELVGEPGAKLQLAGSIKEVVNKTPFSDLQLVKGSAEKITVDEYARGSQVLVDTGTRADEMNLDVATLVTGEGDIGNLNVGANDCEVDILPDNVVIRPGLTATVDGEEMGSAAASELSAEPRLLAGYPSVINIAPTQADGLFSANKPGTIYWAISELADGSVSAEDLISNPTYGGNIYSKQAGSIAASSRTEYSKKISSLTPDGSYYISAIMVDGRGRRSPVKVAAFTTPDNTVPAFVKGPDMTKEKCDIAQVTATPNKSCLLYYVLLPEGAKAPTPQEFKSGSIGGNYGYGSLSVVKNVPVSIKVNRNRLQEKTTYWLYLWLTDHNGAQSMATPVRKEVKIGDETPPIVTAPTQTGIGASTADITFAINEAPSILYWVVVKEGDNTFIPLGDDPEENARILSDRATKIKVAESGSGGPIVAKGSTKAAGAGVATQFRISGLNTTITKTNNYIMYYVAKDGDGKNGVGNYSDKVGFIRIRTLDTVKPKLLPLEFSNAEESGPWANSDVRIVFSEQVKGGPAATKTFVDYYNDVLSATTTETRNAAKETLGKVLAACIKMYTWSREGEKELTPRQDGAGDDWVIDWREAIVSQRTDGSVVINLPSGTAIRMTGGVTYFFRYSNIYDDAYTPNILEGITANKDYYDQERFTTIYAKVLMDKNPDVLVPTVGGRPIRMDRLIDIDPQSTSNVAATEYWDMVIWSDVSLNFEVYRMTTKTNADGTTEASAWEQVTNEISIVTTSNRGRAISLNEEKCDSYINAHGQYETVVKGLDENTVYTYGIHVTYFNSSYETDRAVVPEYWSGTVNFEFSVIAGNQSDIGEIAGQVENRYKEYVEDGPVNAIGVAVDTQKNRLVYAKTFIDQRAPSFDDNYPMLTAGSSTLYMEVSLSPMGGTVYYVVAPAYKSSRIPTSVKDGNTTIMITAANDGSQIVFGPNDDEAERSRTIADYYGENHYKTYIPINGTDRDNNPEYIYFRSGGSGNRQYKYNAPTADLIMKGKNEYTSPEIQAGKFDVGRSVTPYTVTGLSPSTDYYVYLVVEGANATNNIVEIYRIRTDEAEPPVIAISSSFTSATMTPNDFVDLDYALMSSTTLNEQKWAKGTYYWCDKFDDNTAAHHTGSGRTCDGGCGGEERSVLWALINRPGGSSDQTNFTLYAPDALKKEVADFLTGNEKNGLSGVIDSGTKTYNPSTQTGGVFADFKTVLPQYEEGKENLNTYVLLAVAINHNLALSTTDAKYYGFAAVEGLRHQNLEAPRFSAEEKACIGLNGIPSAYWTVECTGTSIGNWGITNETNRTDDIRRNDMFFKGTVTVGFSAPIYQVDPNTSDRRAILGNEVDTTNNQIYVMNAIYTSLNKGDKPASKDPEDPDAPEDSDSTEYDENKGKLTVNRQSKTDEPRASFTFDFTGIKFGDTITFLLAGNIGGVNPAGYIYPYRVTLMFDPCITTKDINPNSPINTIQGGFWVTLERQTGT